MNTLLQDIRFSLRLLIKTPGFAAAVIAVLSLGIGANTAIFSIVREIVFSPRPYPDAAAVFQFYTQDRKHPENYRQFSYAAFADLRERSAIGSVFSGLLAHTMAMVSIGESDASRRTAAALVSSDYFGTLGVPLAQGRGFLPEEEKPGSAVPVVIASHVYWTKNGRDPRLVGKTIRINERPFTVVGIAPEHFTGTMMLLGPELFLPLGDFDLLTNDSPGEPKRSLAEHDLYALCVVGRLRPGISASAAAATLKVVAADLENAFPAEQKNQSLILRALPRLSTSANPVDESGLGVLGLTLCGLAGIVLLVACLNLMNLLLNRGLARRKEIGIRLSLGASRSRIIRQLLTEGLVLSLAGGAGGVLVGIWSSGLLMKSLGAQMPVALSFHGADPAVFAAAFGLCGFATMCFALVPACRLARGPMLGALKGQAGDSVVVRRNRWVPPHPLVVAQIALSIGILAAAGLFVRSAVEAYSVETGFTADSTLLVEIDAGLAGYDPTRCLDLYRVVGDRLAALPGVESASVASTVPFGFVTINRPVQRAGANPAPDSHPSTAAEGLGFTVRWSSIGADYFATLGLPLLSGRAFSRVEAEAPGAPAVAIIDEVLAKKLWPEGNALGRRIQWAAPGAPTAYFGGHGTMGISNELPRNPLDARELEIVGIVPATRWEFFQSEVGGQIYVPFAQGIQSSVFLHVRTSPRLPGTDAAWFDTVRRSVRAAAPGVPAFEVKTFRHHLDDNLQFWLLRAGAAMVSVWGCLAWVLAIVGLYGVKAYAVARRTREIGIRMALGAQRGAVVRMIVREGLGTTFAGTVLGLLLAYGIGRMIGGMLFQVSPTDSVAFFFAPLALAATALAACWLPARRAARVDPLVALRWE